MANILKSFFSQCARPKGALGRVMLSFMNYTHAPLTNWGLKLVDVQDGWTMLDVGCGGGFTIRRLLKAASKRGQSPLGFAALASARTFRAFRVTYTFRVKTEKSVPPVPLFDLTH